jgi:hypothetical protein
MAKKKKKKSVKRFSRLQQLAGLAVLFVTIVVAVVVLSVRRDGQIYHTEPPEEVVASGRVLVEVLNGCGAKGAAKVVAEGLRARGFDVVRIGNADDFGYAHTLVIDRSGSSEKAEEVARAMACSRVVTQVAGDAFLDVTVVLGADGLWRQGLLASGDSGW